MARFGFVGPSYQSQSVNADAQSCVNFFPEILESGSGKSSLALYPTPGLQIAYILGVDPIRCTYTFNGRSFAVSGTNLVELNVDGTMTIYAGLANDGQVAIIAGGGASGALQLLIQSGGNGYVFNLQTNTLTQVPPAMQIGPWSNVMWIDGFFIAAIANSSAFQLSNINDATTWNLANVTGIELIPDLVVSSLADHREAWLWGSRNAVVYFNSGDPLFPFAPIPGAFLEQGSIAQWGALRIDNTICWLGGDERGAGIAWRAQGYSPVRISNHAVEYAWQNYPTIADAIAYPYQDAGHSFAVWSFPTAGKTWAYDVSTGMWHERAFHNPNSGQFEAHRARFHTFNFGKHLVGDYTTGIIYRMSTNVYNDFGNPIVRVRRAPHISSEQEWIFHHQLQVDAEMGLGQFAFLGIYLADSNGQTWLLGSDDSGNLTTTKTLGIASILILNDPTNAASWQIGVDTSGNLTTTSVALGSYPTSFLLSSNSGNSFWSLGVTLIGLLTTASASPGASSPTAVAPQFMLRWSDDGGHKWSNSYMASAGNAGDYKARAMWRRLGRSRDRVYELSTSDNAAWRIVDAYLLASPGYTPTERMATQLRKAG